MSITSERTFLIAGSLEEALAAVEAGARPVAGGTDLVVGVRQGKSPLPESLVAIDRLDELVGIVVEAEEIRIGAGTTHATLMAHPLVVEHCTAIADAAALVGSPATRHIGTLGGNVMTASPAMDTGAPLMVLGAAAVLQSVDRTRTLPLHQLWSGPGQTTAEPNELCVALAMPLRPARSGSAYVRLEYRRAMEIAVVGAAASLVLNDDGTVADASVALTAVAPTILGLHGVKELVAGRTADESTLAEVAKLASDQAVPISDLRATDLYRRHCVGVMARRAVEAAARRAGGEQLGVPVNRSVGIGAA